MLFSHSQYILRDSVIVIKHVTKDISLHKLILLYKMLDNGSRPSVPEFYLYCFYKMESDETESVFAKLYSLIVSIKITNIERKITFRIHKRQLILI